MILYFSATGNTEYIAKQLASSWGIEYIETSAKTNFNCKEAFEKLAQKIVEMKKSDSSEKKCGCYIY